MTKEIQEKQKQTFSQKAKKYLKEITSWYCYPDNILLLHLWR